MPARVGAHLVVVVVVVQTVGVLEGIDAFDDAARHHDAALAIGIVGGVAVALAVRLLHTAEDGPPEPARRRRLLRVLLLLRMRVDLAQVLLLLLRGEAVAAGLLRVRLAEAAVEV